MIYIRIALVVVFIITAIVYAITRPTFERQADGSVVFEFEPAALRRHVEVLSKDLLPRTCEQPINLERSASYIESEFLKWNPRTDRQHYRFGQGSFSNIVSSFGPVTDEVIIVGAHYDAYASLPGADDNASGVAGILELARALSTKTLQTNILLIAYACEEPPHFAGPGMGSYIHANAMKDRAIQLMISLEMIGYFSSQPDTQKFPHPVLALLYPDRGNFIAVVGRVFGTHASDLKSTINAHTSVNAYSINAPVSVPGIDFSDHRNYWAINVPAVMVTDTAFYRNMNYHTAADTYETLDYGKMAQVIYGVYMHIVALANRI